MVSNVETLRFILWNEPIRVVPAFRPIGKGFCFTRKQIRFLLHNDSKRLRVYTIAVFSFVRTFAP